MASNMNTTNDDKWKAIAQEGDINLLYTLIQDDPYVFEHIDLIPFVETPLHIAASAGHVHFAIELMRLKPSYARKLNQQGFCPIHVAMQHGQEKMVLGFVDFDKDLVQVKGREGLTPLHLASQTGKVDLLDTFLSACPDSIEDVTLKSETALHVAVKNKQYNALEHLIQWLQKNLRRGAWKLGKTILNRKDEEGNTILHISAQNNDLRALRVLLKAKKLLHFTPENLEGNTALDIAAGRGEIEDLLKVAAINNGCLIKLSESLEIKLIRGLRNLTMEERNTYLVVATLIATAAYQAALSPPGGLYQANPSTDNTLSHLNTIDSSLNWKRNTGIGGNSVMTNWDFIIFAFINMFSFFFSTGNMLLLLPENSIWLLRLSILTISLQWSYVFSMMIISPTRVTSCFLVVVYLIFMGIGFNSLKFV